MKLRFSPPKHWAIARLDTVAEVRTGVAKGRNGLKAPVSLPYMRVANVQDGYLDLSEVKYIEVEEHEVDRYALKPGDVLMNEGGDFDKLGRGHIWHGELPVCLHQNHVFAVRPDAEKLDSRFLNYFTGSFHGKLYFLSCSKQTTNLASINSSQVRAMPIPLPPLGEQRRIAEILGAWDDAIEKVQALIQAKQKLKRALMHQLLSPTRRFPQFHGNPWPTVKLRDAGAVRSGGTPSTSRPEYWNGEIPWVTPTEITALRGGRYLSSTERRITPGGLAGSGADLIPTRSVIVCTRATVGDCAINTVPMTSNQGFKSFTPHDGSPEFAYYAMCALKKAMKRVAAGSTFVEVSATAFGGLDFPKPSPAEQQRIAEVLMAVDDQIEAQTSIAAKLVSQKRGLMQKLLTGQVRVKEAGA